MSHSADRLMDHPAREQSLEGEQSFIVQAPAGSGKTELLIQRILVLLARVRQPEEVLAITFTKKAAVEMRTRVIQALQSAKNPHPPEAAYALTTWELARAVLERDKRFEWQLMAEPSRLRIMTFDALCGHLLRAMPSGGVPSHTVTDKPTRYYKEAVRSMLRDLDTTPVWGQAMQSVLLQLDNQWDRLEELLIDLLARREHWLPHILDDERATRANLERSLKTIVVQHLETLKAHWPSEINTELECLIRYARENLGATGFLSAWPEEPAWDDFSVQSLTQWQLLASFLLTKTGTLRKNITISMGFPAGRSSYCKEMKRRMSALLTSLEARSQLIEALSEVAQTPPATYTNSQWALLSSLLTILPVLSAYLEVVFQTKRVMDFSGVAQAALLSLGTPEDPTDLSLRLDYNIAHILVDEFQDTSLTQFSLLECLTAGWQAGDGRTLFLVGDPMQSIYRFRDAEVGLFLKAWEEGVGSIQLTPLRLSVNFRSEPSLVAWFNQHFRLIFPENDDIPLGAVCYQEAHTPFQGGDEHQRSSKSVQVACWMDEWQEAQSIAKRIARVQAAEPKSTVAILVRARWQVAAITDALSRHGIDYAGIDLLPLSSDMAVQDLLSLTRALLWPHDKMAWVSVIRAPWCGLGLSDLHALHHTLDGDVLWSVLKGVQDQPLCGVSSEGNQRLRRFSKVMAQAIGKLEHVKLQTLVERTWLALGGPATLPQQSSWRNVETFFTMLDEYQADDLLFDFESLLERTSRLYASSRGGGSVQIMTIHKAKGLEFDHVFLPALGASKGLDQPALLIWAENPQRVGKNQLLLAPLHREDARRDNIYDYLRRQQRQKNKLESQRLFYVAATRAKKTLYLSASLDCSDDPQPKHGSLLSLAWETLGADFLSARDEAERLSPRPTLPTHHARGMRRLPAAWDYPESIDALLLEDGGLHEEEILGLELPSELFPSADRLIGQCVHHLLDTIVKTGLVRWERDAMPDIEPYVRHWLLAHWITPCECVSAMRAVLHCVQQILACDRGRWILSEHSNHASEQSHIQSVNDGTKEHVIDRTFVDAQGVRWIIDYKTSHLPEGMSQEAFLSLAKKDHQAQLVRYARIFAQLGELMIRCALYFPMFSGWTEWPFDTNVIEDKQSASL